MYGVNVAKARRWFWGLTVLAVLDMGVLYRALKAPASPGVGLTVVVSGLVLAGATVQATRIWAALSGRRRGSRSR